MPKYRPPPAPKPTVKVTVELHDEEFEVDVIVPYWAMHLVKGGEPHDEWDEEMWKLQSQENGLKLAEKKFEELKAANLKQMSEEDEARVESLTASFNVFDADGSGELTTDEVITILQRVTPAGTQMTEDDAKAFIKEFDRDDNGTLNLKEFITAMGVISDAAGLDGEEETFAEMIAEGDTMEVKGMEAGKVSEAVENARKVQIGLG